MPETEQTVVPPLPPTAPPLRRVPNVGPQCRTCQKFEQGARAVSALADVDALPASVYFRINELLAPARRDHMRRSHPSLWAYEQQAAAARSAALGIRST